MGRAVNLALVPRIGGEFQGHRVQTRHRCPGKPTLTPPVDIAPCEQPEGRLLVIVDEPHRIDFILNSFKGRTTTHFALDMGLGLGDLHRATVGDQDTAAYPQNWRPLSGVSSVELGQASLTVLHLLDHREDGTGAFGLHQF